MIVVGGSYRELCSRPERDEMYGSGLRAAAALLNLSSSVQLTSAADEDSRLAVEIMIKTYGIEAQLIARDEPVAFSYFTPLDSPAITGRTAKLVSTLKVADDVALVFGMVESGELHVDAERLIYDPQRPRELAAQDLSSIHGQQLAIVLNRSEAAALAGDVKPEDALMLIAERTGASVVIIKSAAMGAFVLAEGEIQQVGVFETPRVYPIGSGDVFAAGFAWAWGEARMDAVKSARVGSLAAATWCATEVLPLPAEVAELKSGFKELPPSQVQVYLAGPFFSLAEQWLVETCRSSIRAMGAMAFSPLHDVGRTGDEIADRDLRGLAASQSVLALLDGADTGTWFEVGWAMKAGIPVVAYCNPTNVQQLKMAHGTGVEVCDDLSTAVYRAVWAGQR